jgi:DNA repair protein RAD51/nuclear pore complex protein Nup160
MFSLEDADTREFIPGDQRNYFSDGLPKYYYHILGLFEKSKAWSFVADFARLGLRCIRGREDEQLKTDLLSRLFTASIQTARFDDAYSALTRNTDRAL